MNPHWSEWRTQIAAQVAAQKQLFVGCDFDGTLATITDRPENAAIEPGAREALAALAAVPGVHVAIVSGRSLADVKGRVGLGRIVYVGNHGLEIMGSAIGEWRPVVSHASRTELQLALRRLHESLDRTPGVIIEDKRLTGSVHYRLAPAELHSAIGRSVQAVTRGCRALAARQGHMVWEIRPRCAWNKGAAVRTLLAHFGVPEAGTVYFGDDIADEDVFSSIPGGLTFHVGSNASSAARFSVRNPAEVVELLDWLRDARSTAHRPERGRAVA